MIVLFIFISRQDVCPACFPIIALFLCSYNAIRSLIFSHFSVSNQSISQNGLGIHRIAVLLYRISAVSLNRMYRSSIAAFHDSYMVTGSVMIPIKKDDSPWCRNTSSTPPFPPCLKPSYTIRTNRKLRYCFLLNESCLVMKAERSSGHGGDLQRDKNGVPALSAGVRIKQDSFKRKQYRSFLFVRMV